MEESRVQFEREAALTLNLPTSIIESARKGDGYDHAFDSMNIMQPLNEWWNWWKKSRAAIEISIPAQSEYDDPLSAYNAIKDCAAAIRAAGLKIKAP